MISENEELVYMGIYQKGEFKLISGDSQILFFVVKNPEGKRVLFDSDYIDIIKDSDGYTLDINIKKLRGSASPQPS